MTSLIKLTWVPWCYLWCNQSFHTERYPKSETFRIKYLNKPFVCIILFSSTGRYLLPVGILFSSWQVAPCGLHLWLEVISQLEWKESCQKFIPFAPTMLIACNIYESDGEIVALNNNKVFHLPFYFEKNWHKTKDIVFKIVCYVMLCQYSKLDAVSFSQLHIGSFIKFKNIFSTKTIFKFYEIKIKDWFIKHKLDVNSIVLNYSLHFKLHVDPWRKSGPTGLDDEQQK